MPPKQSKRQRLAAKPIEPRVFFEAARTDVRTAMALLGPNDTIEVANGVLFVNSCTANDYMPHHESIVDLQKAGFCCTLGQSNAFVHFVGKYMNNHHIRGEQYQFDEFQVNGTVLIGKTPYTFGESLKKEDDCGWPGFSIRGVTRAGIPADEWRKFWKGIEKHVAGGAFANIGKNKDMVSTYETTFLKKHVTVHVHGDTYNDDLRIGLFEIHGPQDGPYRVEGPYSVYIPFNDHAKIRGMFDTDSIIARSTCIATFGGDDAFDALNAMLNEIAIIEIEEDAS